MPLPLAIKSDQVFDRKSLGWKANWLKALKFRKNCWKQKKLWLKSLEIEKTVEKTEKFGLKSPKCSHTHMKILIFYLKIIIIMIMYNVLLRNGLHFASSVALSWVATPPAHGWFGDLPGHSSGPWLTCWVLCPHVGGPNCNFCKKERGQWIVHENLHVNKAYSNLWMQKSWITLNCKGWSTLKMLCSMKFVAL